MTTTPEPVAQADLVERLNEQRPDGCDIAEEIAARSCATADKLATRMGWKFVPFDASGPEIKPLAEPVAPVLVERLNTAAAYLRTRIAATLRTIANDCEQAAAEITRLRAELARKDEALRVIVSLADQDGINEYARCPDCTGLEQIARAALKEPNQ